jgi:hypothetical protein
MSIDKEILAIGYVSHNRFDFVAIVKSNDINGRIGKWQEDCLKGNLFQVDDGIVFFQNRATRQFVREYSNYNFI